MIESQQNKAFYWATVFLRELHANGISHLVISPGSRSTPLTLAAAVHSGLNCHVVLDERSAAFMALGIGKATGTPAGLICTSGTAAANYYPAVIEARHSGVPLLVLTADRPPNLRDIGASQAIDQVKLFGDYPVFFYEAGEPVLEDQDLNRLKTAASQSVSKSINRGGASHVNFAFRKPLEPAPDFVDQIEKENSDLISNRKPPKTSVHTSSDTISLSNDVQKLLSEAQFPVVIDGPIGINSTKQEAGEIADLLQAPLLAEYPIADHANRIKGFDGFLKKAPIRKKFSPDLILRFGQQPVSKALHFYLKEHSEIPHIHFGGLDEWQDATHSVTHRIEWFGRPVDWQLSSNSTDPDWLQDWKRTDWHFDNLKKEKLNAEGSLTDGHVFNQIAVQVPDHWNVFLSNSFPVRDWMLFGGSPPHPTFVNRGTSGIDGIISTAIGATLAGDKPGILFIGDLATLHDCNALLSSKLLKQPLVLVVLNNGGGNIFRMLPIFEHKNVYSEFFETPQQAAFSSLAGAHNVRHQVVSSLDELENLNLADITEPGLHLVECQTNADASMRLRHALWNFGS